MLKLILTHGGTYILKDLYLNTSHVKVNQELNFNCRIICKNLNTSHVKVNRRKGI